MLVARESLEPFRRLNGACRERIGPALPDIELGCNALKGNCDISKSPRSPEVTKLQMDNEIICAESSGACREGIGPAVPEIEHGCNA